MRQSSRLELARSLQWLAAFGITHAFNEWGDLFIPLQAEYLSPMLMRYLYLAQLVFLTTSFACLFEFGTTILRSIGRADYLKDVSGILAAGWLVSVALNDN